MKSPPDGGLGFSQDKGSRGALWDDFLYIVHEWWRGLNVGILQTLFCEMSDQ